MEWNSERQRTDIFSTVALIFEPKKDCWDTITFVSWIPDAAEYKLMYSFTVV